MYLGKNKHYDTLSFTLFTLYFPHADERCFEFPIGVKSLFRQLIHMITRVQKLKRRRRGQSLEHSILFGKEKASWDFSMDCRHRY
jgi:hypothetical protein